MPRSGIENLYKENPEGLLECSIEELSVMLTDGQRKFAENWIVTGNTVAAHRAAHPESKATYRSIVAHAAEMLKHPKVKAYIQARREELRSKTEVTPEKLITLQAERAFFSPRDLLDPVSGFLIPMHKLPDNVARQITKLRFRQAKPKTHITDLGEVVEMEQQIIDIEWDSGQAARESLMKVFGLYEKDNNQKAQQVSIYNEVRAQIEKEMVEEVMEEIEQQNEELAGLDQPNLTL